MNKDLRKGVIVSIPERVCRDILKMGNEKSALLPLPKDNFIALIASIIKYNFQHRDDKKLCNFSSFLLKTLTELDHNKELDVVIMRIDQYKITELFAIKPNLGMSLEQFLDITPPKPCKIKT
jgi:hypothetical protein